MDGTGSGSCVAVGFGISGVELPENQRSARPGVHKSQGPSCPDD